MFRFDFKLTNAGPSPYPACGHGLYQVMAVIAGIAVLAISSHIKIPFYPVSDHADLGCFAIGMTYIRLGGATCWAI